MSELIFCTECGQAVLDKEKHCPHCGFLKPQRGSLDSQAILTTLLLGLSITACNPESEPQTIESKEPVAENVETVPEKEPANPKEASSQAEKEAEVEEAVADAAEAPPKEEPLKEALPNDPPKGDLPKDPPKKESTSKLGGLGMLPPDKAVGAKYGVPATSPSFMTKGQVFLGDIDEASCENASKMIRRRMNQVRYCYQRALQRAPQTEGSITVDLQIHEGKVEKVNIKNNSTKNKNLASCITNRAQRIRLAPSCKDTVSVRYQFKNKK